jgi:Zn-dependent M28 family amino/carboxypeptidase
MAHRPPSLPRIVLIVAVALATACQSASPSPQPSPSAAASATGSDGGASVDLAVSEALRDAVTPEAIQAHLDALDAIAASSDGTRASGTDGYTLSRDYVADALTEAGYEVTVDEFTFPYFNELSPPMVAVIGGPTFAGDDHLRALIYSRSGDLEAPIVTVSVDDEGQPIGSGGCEASDWASFPEGSIALAGPGPCFRRQMVEEAQNAGAVALIVSSASYEPGAVRRPTLIDPDGIEIPALYASNEAGAALLVAAQAGGSVHLSVETLIQDRITANVLAERTGSQGDPETAPVVMMGGHLDSVIDGPGINDNGSGTGTILEIALQLAEMEPTDRTVRFAFWAAEELGLMGSYQWVTSQDQEELDRIVAYLNLDMVGSPNFVRQVYDSSSAVTASGAITDAFGAYFDAVDLTWESEDIGGGSDHAGFEDFLIPTGGLFSGASEEKSAAQANLFGGEAGAPIDPCYHLTCDVADQVNDEVLDQLSDAAAHVLMLLLTGRLL